MYVRLSRAMLLRLARAAALAAVLLSLSGSADAEEQPGRRPMVENPRADFGEESRNPALLAAGIVLGFALLLTAPRLASAALGHLAAPVCRECHSLMRRLDDQQDDPYLDSGERAEERLGSIDHRVWRCTRCARVRKRPRPRLRSPYTLCPRCDRRTLLKSSRLLSSATYEAAGRVRAEESCGHCSYRRVELRREPRLRPPGGTGFQLDPRTRAVLGKLDQWVEESVVRLGNVTIPSPFEFDEPENPPSPPASSRKNPHRSEAAPAASTASGDRR